MNKFFNNEIYHYGIIFFIIILNIYYQRKINILKRKKKKVTFDEKNLKDNKINSELKKENKHLLKIILDKESIIYKYKTTQKSNVILSDMYNKKIIKLEERNNLLKKNIKLLSMENNQEVKYECNKLLNQIEDYKCKIMNLEHKNYSLECENVKLSRDYYNIKRNIEEINNNNEKLIDKLKQDKVDIEAELFLLKKEYNKKEKLTNILEKQNKDYKVEIIKLRKK